MFYKDLCIVLKTVNYKDYDKMLTLFAQNKGKISAQAKGSRKQTSPFLSCSQLFACGEYSFYQKGEKYFLSQCVIKKTFGRIMEDMDRYLLASFFAELTEKVLMENQANTKLFSLLINTLYQVEEEPLKFHELFCYFGMKMLDLLGYRPQTERCVICGTPEGPFYISAKQGGVICGDCAGHISDGIAIEEQQRQVLSEMLRTSPIHMGQASWQCDAFLAKITMTFLNYYIGLHLKSFQLLRENLFLGE